MATIPLPLSLELSSPILSSKYGDTRVAPGSVLEFTTSLALTSVDHPRATLPWPANTFAFVPIATPCFASTAAVVTRPFVSFTSATPTTALSPRAIPEVPCDCADVPIAIAFLVEAMTFFVSSLDPIPIAFLPDILTKYPNAVPYPAPASTKFRAPTLIA